MIYHLSNLLRKIIKCQKYIHFLMFPVINDYDLLYWFLAVSFVFVCIFLLKHHLCVYKMFNYSLLHTEFMNISKGKPQNKSNFLSTSFANTEMYSHLKTNATFGENGHHLHGLNHVLYVNKLCHWVYFTDSPGQLSFSSSALIPPDLCQALEISPLPRYFSSSLILKTIPLFD